MNFARTAATAAALCFGLGVTGTIAADASVPANIMGCFDMAKKVKAALDTAQQSPNFAEARAESGVGRDYCARQMYREGVSHYANALKLLGTG